MKSYQGFNYATDIEDANDTTASLPNVVVYQTHDYDEMVERGDSGGPIFICKTHLPCKLIAITTGSNEDYEEVATTFITPFFQNLVTQFNY
jgi:V8-like Glu-specific endopeptidase